jgi:hypothetical protein
MIGTIKPLAAELRLMPMLAGSADTDPRAGIPFELADVNLPSITSDQLQYLRDLIAESSSHRERITNEYDPTPKQKNLLAQMETIDTAMSGKLG